MMSAQSSPVPEANPRVAREIVIDGAVRLPVITTFEQFLDWRRSDTFPERGRFSYLAGTIWIEVCLEQEHGFAHDEARAEVEGVLRSVVRRDGGGRVFTNGARLIVRPVDLSTVPDAMFVHNGTVQAGRATVASGRNRVGIVQMVGPPDMVLEVISAWSVEKDTVELPGLYHAAGIPEFWRVDARGELRFEILRRDLSGYVPTQQPDGWWRSEVFERDFLLTAEPDLMGPPWFALEHRP